MKLSAPTTITFLVAVIIAIAAFLIQYGIVPVIALAGFSLTAFWLMAVAFILLALGCLLKGF